MGWLPTASDGPFRAGAFDAGDAFDAADASEEVAGASVPGRTAPGRAATGTAAGAATARRSVGRLPTAARPSGSGVGTWPIRPAGAVDSAGWPEPSGIAEVPGAGRRRTTSGNAPAGRGNAPAGLRRSGIVDRRPPNAFVRPAADPARVNCDSPDGCWLMPVNAWPTSARRTAAARPVSPAGTSRAIAPRPRTAAVDGTDAAPEDSAEDFAMAELAVDAVPRAGSATEPVEAACAPAPAEPAAVDRAAAKPMAAELAADAAARRTATRLARSVGVADGEAVAAVRSAGGAALRTAGELTARDGAVAVRLVGVRAGWPAMAGPATGDGVRAEAAEAAAVEAGVRATGEVAEAAARPGAAGAEVRAIGTFCRWTEPAFDRSSAAVPTTARMPAPPPCRGVPRPPLDTEVAPALAAGEGVAFPLPTAFPGGDPARGACSRRCSCELVIGPAATTSSIRRTGMAVETRPPAMVPGERGWLSSGTLRAARASPRGGSAARLTGARSPDRADAAVRADEAVRGDEAVRADGASWSIRAGVAGWSVRADSAFPPG